MSEVPSDLYYTRRHEWVRQDDDTTVTVGITDHAQAQLGDLVFVEVPEEGASLGVDDNVAVVESVKAASDVYAPIAGEVATVNDALADNPEQINNDPFGEGWIFQLRIENTDALGNLLNSADYEAFAESEDG